MYAGCLLSWTLDSFCYKKKRQSILDVNVRDIIRISVEADVARLPSIKLIIDSHRDTTLSWAGRWRPQHKTLLTQYSIGVTLL